MNNSQEGVLELVPHYKKYFYTVKANTSDLKKQAYNVRYQVYYEERKMVSVENIHGDTESDVWDENAVQCLLFHKPSNRPIGYIRLIPLETSITHTLPLEEHYSKLFDFQSTPIKHLHQGKTGEVSRMAILSSFRRRNSDYIHSLKPHGNVNVIKEKRTTYNYIPMYLAFTAIILMEKERLDYGVALMEPGLERLLIRFGIKLKQFGEPVNYYGLRAPYLIFPESTYSNLPCKYRELYDVIKKDICGSSYDTENAGMKTVLT